MAGACPAAEFTEKKGSERLVSHLHLSLNCALLLEPVQPLAGRQMVMDLSHPIPLAIVSLGLYGAVYLGIAVNVSCAGARGLMNKGRWIYTLSLILGPKPNLDFGQGIVALAHVF